MGQKQLGIRKQWRKESSGAWKGKRSEVGPQNADTVKHQPKLLSITGLPGEVSCCRILLSSTLPNPLKSRASYSSDLKKILLEKIA